MQQRFQSRAIVSWAASALAHGLLLVCLSFAFQHSQGGRVSVLDVRIVSEQAPAPRAAKDVSRATPGQKAAPAQATPVAGRQQNPGGEGAGNPTQRLSYIQSLRAAIEGVKTYPRLARARRQEGRVEVAFTLRKDGVITDVEIASSSAFPVLDEEGANTLGRLGRFQPIPDEVSKTDLRLVLPLEFQLQD